MTTPTPPLVDTQPHPVLEDTAPSVPPIPPAEHMPPVPVRRRTRPLFSATERAVIAAGFGLALVVGVLGGTIRYLDELHATGEIVHEPPAATSTVLVPQPITMIVPAPPVPALTHRAAARPPTSSARAVARCAFAIDLPSSSADPSPDSSSSTSPAGTPTPTTASVPATTAVPSTTAAPAPPPRRHRAPVTSAPRPPTTAAQPGC